MEPQQKLIRRPSTLTQVKNHCISQKPLNSSQKWLNFTLRGVKYITYLRSKSLSRIHLESLQFRDRLPTHQRFCFYVRFVLSNSLDMEGPSSKRSWHGKTTRLRTWMFCKRNRGRSGKPKLCFLIWQFCRLNFICRQIHWLSNYQLLSRLIKSIYTFDNWIKDDQKTMHLHLP